jgi:hypothetical protein
VCVCGRAGTYNKTTRVAAQFVGRNSLNVYWLETFLIRCLEERNTNLIPPFSAKAVSFSKQLNEKNARKLVGLDIFPNLTDTAEVLPVEVWPYD